MDVEWNVRFGANCKLYFHMRWGKQMPGHDIIVVGASAGGVEALTQLMFNLPSEVPAAIFIVLHIPPQSVSVLPKILNRALKKRHQSSSLLAIHPEGGEAIQHGRIYVAPPDHHLLVKAGYVSLTRGPRENSHRPAVDPLFRTAALNYGPRVVGIVLSGTLDDGTAGLLAIKQRGGVAIVQDPNEALYSGMPTSAIENVAVDHILPVSGMGAILVKLAQQPVEIAGTQTVPSDMENEAEMAELDFGAIQSSEHPGTPSPFGCPECGGVLWELNEGKLLRFRCRTGHAYSVGSLLAEQSEAQEEALWKALRALEEKASLVERLAKRAKERNQTISAKRFGQESQELQQRAFLVRQLLVNNSGNGKLSKVKDQEDGVVDLSSNEVAQSQVAVAQATVNTGSFKVVAICASVGGMQAIAEVLSDLPGDISAALLIVVPAQGNACDSSDGSRAPAQSSSKMVEALSRSTALRVKQAESGERLHPGTVYMAPLDHHLLVNPGNRLALSNTALVHFVRPSVDLLLESVAASCQHRAIAVVLADQGHDGAMGIQAIKQMGGTTIAQKRATSEYFDIPSAAIDTSSFDLVVSLNEIATTLVELVTQQDEDEQPQTES